METNKINENIQKPNDNYEEFIIKIVDNMKKIKNIKLYGKILHYLDKPVFYYNCTSLSNPFDVGIDFGFEFIEGENPYVTILTDFVNPSFKDNRNYYLCLSKDYKYKFSLDDLKSHEIILESMINGIDNFLMYINEMLAVNAFIFFGYYDYNHIYQINDFLQYKNYLNFYRVYELINNTQEERYIIITKLYFLFFTPAGDGDDKALVKLLFCQKLKDINFFFDRNDQKNSLILKLNKSIYKNDIEFIMLNRKPIEIPKTYLNNKLDLVEEEEKDEIIEKEEKSDYSLLIQEWFEYQDNVNFSNYDIVLNEYKILFIDNTINVKFNDIKIEKISEYNKIIEFYERLVNLYEALGNHNDLERINKLKSNIIYLCSELVDFGNTENGQDNKYLVKIREYISSYNKKK